MIIDLNSQVAFYRFLLLNVGQTRDCPEMREKIRKVRRQCVEVCRNTSQLLMPQIRSDVADGIPVDTDQLVHFFCCCQLLFKELNRSHRLAKQMPLDMSSLYEQRPGTSGLGGVLSQIILGKQIMPDFNLEELASISRDSQDIRHLLEEMQEYMPLEESKKDRALTMTGEDSFSAWRRRKKRGVYSNLRTFCCACRPHSF
ncbi:uncharacterized protein LOC136028859 isoform X2 [Artemia franciscana]